MVVYVRFIPSNFAFIVFLGWLILIQLFPSTWIHLGTLFRTSVGHFRPKSCSAGEKWPCRFWGGIGHESYTGKFIRIFIWGCLARVPHCNENVKLWFDLLRNQDYEKVKFFRKTFSHPTKKHSWSCSTVFFMKMNSWVLWVPNERPMSHPNPSRQVQFHQ